MQQCRSGDRKVIRRVQISYWTFCGHAHSRIDDSWTYLPISTHKSANCQVREKSSNRKKKSRSSNPKVSGGGLAWSDDLRQIRVISRKLGSESSSSSDVFVNFQH